MSLRGGEQLAGPQHHVKPEASLRKPPRERGQGGAEPVWGGRRPRTAPGILERVPMNLPAHGVLSWELERPSLAPGLRPGKHARL